MRGASVSARLTGREITCTELNIHLTDIIGFVTDIIKDTEHGTEGQTLPEGLRACVQQLRVAFGCVLAPDHQPARGSRARFSVSCHLRHSSGGTGPGEMIAGIASKFELFREVDCAPAAGSQAAFTGYYAEGRALVFCCAGVFLDQDRVEEADLGYRGDQVGELGEGGGVAGLAGLAYGVGVPGPRSGTISRRRRHIPVAPGSPPASSAVATAGTM
jgi:hypothetical protein